MLKLSLREAVSSPAMQFAVIEAWLTLPDWVTRRTEIVELEDASTASHTIVLDITLPNSLREKLTIYPQQSDAAAKARERALDADAPGGKQAPEEVERTTDEDEADRGCEEMPEGGMVLLPALFLRRGMPLPRLGITLGQDEIKGTYLPKELSDTLMQGVIALTNDRPVPGPHQAPIQRFECECPEAAWQCKRSSCPGRSERDEDLPNGKLKSCPPPTSPLRRYEWPYCPYAEEEDCTCVKERCPAATLTYPEVVGPDDRGLKAFLDSHLSTDYGMVIVAPESAVKGSFRLEITFTRELTKWDRPHEIQRLSKKRRRNSPLPSWLKRRRRASPVARCGPFQGVVERASYPRHLLSSIPIFPWLPSSNGSRARYALCRAARQTDRLKTGWKQRTRLLHGWWRARRMVANHGAAMTIGVQTSSLGDAGTFHFVFGAPKGMQITPSGGWIHDWPAWRRANLSEGIETLQDAEPQGRRFFGAKRGYTDDFVPIDGKGDDSESPAPYVAFLPARGIDEKVAMRPTPSDLLPLSPPSDTRGPTHRFSPGSSLMALIQFRPKTNLPFFGIVTNGLLLALIALLALVDTEGAFLQREDAWVAVFLLAPALLAGVTASRDHPVAASLVRKYRIVLGATALLALTLAAFLLASTSTPTNDSGAVDVPFPDASLHMPISLSPFDLTSPLSISSPGLQDVVVIIIAALSLLLLIYSLFHLLVNRAAHRWADDYSVNQLDLVSPSRGFKLDTMRRPWCDPSPIRPEQALEELEALRIRFMGFEATGGASNGSVKGDAWHSGVDSLVFSSQELTSTFTESTDEEGRDQRAHEDAEAESEDDEKPNRGKKPRTREQLLEKYGVELPDYVPSETEMVFRDGRFFEREIHAALGNSDLSFVDLSPRHAQRAGGSDVGVLTPTAADDDLDRHLMTVMAMEAGVDVIAEGCLMGRYTPPLGDPVGPHWLEIQLKTASEAQLNRFMTVLADGKNWSTVWGLLTDEGDGSWDSLEEEILLLLRLKPANEAQFTYFTTVLAATEWITPLSREQVEGLFQVGQPHAKLAAWLQYKNGEGKRGADRLSNKQLDRLLQVLLRTRRWESVRKKLCEKRGSKNGVREESWRELKYDERWEETSPVEAVAGIPIRRFKGFPDLLIKRSLVEGLVGSNYPLDYVPVDIKQGNPFKTTERERKVATVDLTEKINASGDRSVTLLADFPESARERDHKPQYLAQLGLYSVLLRQAKEVSDRYQNTGEERRRNVSSKREALTNFRRWITDEDTFAKEIAPYITIDAVPDDAALWIVRGDGRSSRILPIPGPYLARQLEKATWDLVTMQAKVALKNPQIIGEPNG